MINFMKQVLLRLLNSYTVGFQTLIAQLIQGFQSYLINPEYSPSSAQSSILGQVGEGQGGKLEPNQTHSGVLRSGSSRYTK